MVHDSKGLHVCVCACMPLCVFAKLNTHLKKVLQWIGIVKGIDKISQFALVLKHKNLKEKILGKSMSCIGVSTTDHFSVL